MVDRPETHQARRVYFWGGVLLVVAGVWMAFSAATDMGAFRDVFWALYDSGVLPLFQTIAILLPLAAALVFAFGSRDGGSVVARRPLGIVAIAVFAVIPPLLFLLAELRVALGDIAGGVTYLTAYSIQVVAGIVALREITRAGVIPRSRMWLPILAVGMAALTIALVLIGLFAPSGLGLELYVLWKLGAPALTLVFGIVAIASSRNRGGVGGDAPDVESPASSLG